MPYTFSDRDGSSWHTTNVNASLPINTWTHVVATRKAGEDAKVYYNGVAQPLTSVSWPLGTISYTNTWFALGRQKDLGRNFDGKIEDAAIWNRALSSAEVNNFYKSYKGNWFDQNLVAYYKFDSKSGTTIFDSARGNSGTLTNGADTNAQGLWDTNALWLNGTNAYVSLGTASALKPTSAITVSAWVKPTATDLSSGRAIVEGRANNATAMGYTLFINGITTGKMGWLVRTSGPSWNAILDSNFVFVPEQWYHLVGIYASGDARFYVNGILQNSTNAVTGSITYDSANTTIAATNGTTNLFQGRIEEVKIYNRPLSFVEIQAEYNRGLFDSNYVSRIIDTNSGYIGSTGTDYNYLVLNSNNGLDKNGHIYGTQIEPTIEKDLNIGLKGLWHLNADTTDSSGNGNNGTWNGTPVYTTGLWGTNAGSFNGSNTKVSIPTSICPQPEITISGWVKANSFSANTHIYGDRDSVGTNEFHVGFPNGVLSATGYWNSAYQFSIVSPTVLSGTWYHIVASYKLNEAKLYLNGILVGSDTSVVGRPSATVNCQFGSWFSDSYALNGLLDDVALWNRALDANEVKELFNKGAARIGVKYRSCESISSCTRNWSALTYPTTTNQISLNTLDGNRFIQYALYPALYQFPDGNYLPQAFATIKDINIIYTN